MRTHRTKPSAVANTAAKTATKTVKRRVAKSTAISLAFLALLASPAQADRNTASHNVQAKKLCYCGCDHEMGAPMCAHMCELPKYQDRWWATSCRRPQPDPRKAISPAPRVHSKQTRRPEQALLK